MSEFSFLVDKIKTSNGSTFDVSSDDLRKAFSDFKSAGYTTPDTGSGPYTPGIDAIWQNRKLDVYNSVSVEDIIKTESYASTASWWNRFFDHRLFKVNVDDSVNLSGVSIFDRADESLSDAELSEKYCISENDISVLRRLCQYNEKVYQICFVRYLITEYNTYTGTYSPEIGITRNISTFLNGTRGTGYYVENAIIDNFNILRLHFSEIDQKLGTIRRTVVVVENESTDYIGSIESGGKLDSDATDPSLYYPWNWDVFPWNSDNGNESISLLRLLRISLITLSVIALVTLSIRLIAPAVKSVSGAVNDKKDRKSKK